MLFLFDWALIALSSVAGASMIIDALTFDPKIETAIVLILALSGILIQAKLLLRDKA